MSNAGNDEGLTAAENEALARITGGHVQPFNHHPCITCAVQAEVARIVAERVALTVAKIEEYEGKVPGYFAESLSRADREHR